MGRVYGKMGEFSSCAVCTSPIFTSRCALVFGKFDMFPSVLLEDGPIRGSFDEGLFNCLRPEN